MAVVYRHIRLDTGTPFYIGIGKTIKRAYSKRNRNFWWQRIVAKCEYYVEILFDNLSWIDACEKEKELIKLYGRKDMNTGILINLTDGGDNSIGYKHTKESLLKISNASKNRSKSDETIRKWKENMNFEKSEETKEKIRKTLKGKKHTKERNEKIRKSHLGKHLSDDTKKKLSEFWKGKKRGPFSEEHKINLMEAKRKKN